MKNSCRYVDLQVSVSHLGCHLEFLKFLYGNRVAPGGFNLDPSKTQNPLKRIMYHKIQVLQRIGVGQLD